MRRLVCLVMLGFVGFIVFSCAGVALRIRPVDGNKHPELTYSARLPHAIPKDQGGLPFRFAMVHDVLCERYPKHGPEHYLARNRATQQKLDALAADDPARFPLMDDLAAGLSRLGQNDEAAKIMREKLKQQEAKGLNGAKLYSTYANLGTFLMLGSLGKARTGDPAAKDQFHESVDLIRKSVEVNPASHFGREQWQLVFGEYILAAIDKPELLTKYDFIGDTLALEGEGLDWKYRYPDTGYGRPYDWEYSRGHIIHEYTDLRYDREPANDEELSSNRNWIRKHITKVGAEFGWKDVPIPALREPVAFDEPCLGIVGMWRQGGGPNPYFALALGEIMLRVGQRYIAWEAYERAVRMSANYWPDEKTQQFLSDHSRKRQREIEQSLSAEEREQLRPRFEAELAYGEQFQKDYQKYEAEKLAAGASVLDEHLFDDFYKGRDPIASPSGSEEVFVGVDTSRRDMFRARESFISGLFLSGVAVMLLAVLMLFFPPEGKNKPEPPHLPGTPYEPDTPREPEA